MKIEKNDGKKKGNQTNEWNINSNLKTNKVIEKYYYLIQNQI